MVFHLLEATHLGNAVTHYLNTVGNKLYRPYDLITVPRSKVKHFLLDRIHSFRLNLVFFTEKPGALYIFRIWCATCCSW